MLMIFLILDLHSGIVLKNIVFTFAALKFNVLEALSWCVRGIETDRFFADAS